MTTTVDPQNSPLPGTVFTPRQVRLLKITVVVLGLLLLAALVAVIAGMIHQASKMTEKKAASARPAMAASPGGAVLLAPFVLPEGAVVSSMALDGERLALHLTTPEGSEIAIIDVTTGNVLSRVKIGAR